MKAKKFSSRLLAMLLMVMMILSLLSTGAFAEGEGGAEPLANTEENEGLKLNKTATLEDDGTYTVKLEAYATGEVKTTTTVEKEPVPADIILILDQSASMGDDMTGIPNDTYDPATVTNAGINGGSYYYQVGDQYYKVTATKELVSSGMQYVGDDDKIYTADQLSYSWIRKSDNQVYNTARPFVTDSLKTFTRTHSGSNSVPFGFQYVNDNDSAEKSGPSDAVRDHAGAEGGRYYFINGKRGWFSSYPAYGNAPYTAEFHNDGAPSAGDTNADDPFYVAASYIAVTQKEVNTYRYTYTYVDAGGKTVIIGSSETGTEAAVDAAKASIDLFTKGTKTGSRLDGLKYAANQFISSIEATGVDHRIAVVGFASDGYKHEDLGTLDWENTELFVGSNQYNYNNGNSGNGYAVDHYSEALQDVSTDAGKANVAASINALGASGATFPQWGFTMAQGIYDKSSSTYIKEDGTEGTRNRIVIFFTDGYPGYNYENPDTAEANATVTKSNTLKNNYKADVYCVACIESLTAGSDADTYLKAVSSGGTYQQATTAEALDAFFKNIEHEVTDTTTTTSVNLTENAILVDELSSYFTIPADFNIADNVTLQTAKHMGYEAFATAATAPADVTASLRTDSNDNITGINVSGFDYVSETNMVKTDATGGSIKADGNKLVVTITGLLAKDEAATGVYVDTNTASSGIWDKDSNEQWAEIKAFPMPHTLLDKKLFVLDYAKEASLDVYNASKIDSAKDGLFSKVGAGSTQLTGNYGKVSAVDGLTYTPATTNWNGYDSFYALGKDNTKGDLKTQNIWSKVSVIPANNVYYEDDFVTNETDGTVGIVYNGTWTTDGTSAGNKESANTEVHGGWQNADLANDTTYSDGSAHLGQAGAKATFTFTGTGVDIYSRTDMKVGTVIAKLEGTTSDGAPVNKLLIVDNESASGTYYQIPTLFFGPLEYGTYTVTLQVTSAGDGEHTYYLDGIRVYNPIQGLEGTDETVQDAYGDNIGAVFTSVRDILLGSESLKADTDVANGAVFIDKAEVGTLGKESYDLAEYKEYGPKNEVYLGKDQAIAFKVNTEDASSKYYLGLKAPSGTVAKAVVTDGDGKTAEIDVKAASDLYYKITPTSDGIIMVKNNGDALLSITKLQTTGEAAVMAASVPSLMAYANTFDSLPVVTYAAVPAAPDSEVTDPEAPAEEPGNVVITEPSGPRFDIVSLLEKIFKGFRGWF